MAQTARLTIYFYTCKQGCGIGICRNRQFGRNRKKLGDSNSGPINFNTAVVKKTEYSTTILDSSVPLYFVQFYFTLPVASFSSLNMLSYSSIESLDYSISVAEFGRVAVAWGIFSIRFRKEYTGFKKKNCPHPVKICPNRNPTRKIMNQFRILACKK